MTKPTNKLNGQLAQVLGAMRQSADQATSKVLEAVTEMGNALNTNPAMQPIPVDQTRSRRRKNNPHCRP